jgi:hypothetical protein
MATAASTADTAADTAIDIDPHFTIGVFATAFPSGASMGLARPATWEGFTAFLQRRREGTKDGICFAAARFQPEPSGAGDDGRIRVHRLGRNLRGRCLVVLDCEANKRTGELPPSVEAMAERVRKAGHAGALYTSHSHDPKAPRYRLVLLPSQEIDPQLPVIDIVAERLGLSGVIDRSKRGAESLFYFPSANPGELEKHQTIIIPGKPMDAAELAAEAGKVLGAQQAEKDRIAAQARAKAAARRQERIARGEDPEWSLIEKIRPHLDMREVLDRHGYDYDERSDKFRHPHSTSGSFGLNIKVLDDDVERLYSFNGTDPLCPDNLPTWCGVKAIDVIDTVTVLEFGGNRSLALRTLAKRFGIPLAEEKQEPGTITNRSKRRVLSRKLFGLLRARAPQEYIEAALLREGARLGLTPAQIRGVACWVVETATRGGA